MPKSKVRQKNTVKKPVRVAPPWDGSWHPEIAPKLRHRGWQLMLSAPEEAWEYPPSASYHLSPVIPDHTLILPSPDGTYLVCRVSTLEDAPENELLYANVEDLVAALEEIESWRA